MQQPPTNGQKSVAIVVAGPIGIEAAIYGLILGYNVHVFEKGDTGHHIRQWGHLRMFSPWKYNRSPVGMELFKGASTEITYPDDEYCPTGEEFLRDYVLPLSKLPMLKKTIHTGVEVLAIGKNNLGKQELIGSPARADRPFRLLLRDSRGEESIRHFDVVIDSSGTYSQHNWMGNGGIPAIGEHELQKDIEYGVEDVIGGKRGKYAGKKTLLIGQGHSAATTLLQFRELIHEGTRTSLVWVIRSERTSPYDLIENDALPLRSELMRAANEIASNAPENITIIRRSNVEAVKKLGKQYTVEIDQAGTKRNVTVDHIMANVGYSPDNTIYRELQVHECYASKAPYKLAAALLGQASQDCLAQTSHGADTLKNPEPNFFIIGSKSYGKNSNFLLRVGIDQVKEVYLLISNDQPVIASRSKRETASAVK
ncbi:MAG: hypothetical protein O7D34_02695 [Ignavibacteria bacterium]|nr:hypothetical protein [Ignavibacteria bacterium]